MNIIKITLSTSILILCLYTNAQEIENLDDLEKSLDNNASVTINGVKSKTNEIKESINLDIPEGKAKAITLRSVIEEGLRKNYTERTREFKRAKIELDFKDAYEDFWYPKLNLTFSTDKTLAQKIYEENKANNSLSKTPRGSLGLEFEDYSLFNWGRDFLEYTNNKETYEREKKRISEKRRELRYDIISSYFYLVQYRKISKIKLYRLRQASFIYRLNREKLSLKKINQEEYLLAKEDYLSSQSAYQESLASIARAEARLANSIGDEPMTSYSPTEELLFKPISLKQNEAYKISLESSPLILDKKLYLENAARTHEKVTRDNLPLPELSLKLGAFRHGFGEDGSHDTFETNPNSKNIELAASINMTWRIFGSGGFLNQRNSKRAFLDKRISEMEFLDAKRLLSVEIRSLFQEIRQFENKEKTNSLLEKTARDAYDRALDNYIGSKTTYPQIRLALDQYESSRIGLESSKYTHLLYKLELAKLMGKDDLPGENFETLGIK